MSSVGAVILAGGLGTRLRPLTNTIPKALIDINGKTLTEHLIGVLKRHGVKNIILSLCYKADKIMRYFGDGSRFGVKIDYLIEKEPMGTAGFLYLMQKPEQSFFVLNGDDLIDVDLNKLVSFHKKNKAIATLTLVQIEEVSSLGVVEIVNDRIVRFVEKPKKGEEPSNWISGGYYVFEPGVFNYTPHPRKIPISLEHEIFPRLAVDRVLYGYKHKGKWFDTGTFESYERVKREWC